MGLWPKKREDDTSGEGAELPGAPRDAGLGVPPFRPALKEAPSMTLAPRANAAPSGAGRPAPLSAPGTVASSGAGSGAGSVMAVPARPERRADPAERRTLVVGRGISLQGTVADAERLVVEGMVESQMIQAAELLVAGSGVFKGEVQVEDAEIAGLFDGTITARGSLTIKASGRVNGIARCRRLAVEEGGQISGRMEMLGEGTELPARPAGAQSLTTRPVAALQPEET